MTSILLFIGLCVSIIGLAIARHHYSKKSAKRRSYQGLEGSKQLIELIKLTQQHRGMHSGFLNGQSEFSSKLDSLKADISHRYNTLLRLEQTLNYPKQLSCQLQYIQWQKLIRHSALNSAQSFQTHSRLIARLLDSLWDMSDEFALTSSQDDTVRALAQQYIKTLPNMAEALGQIRALSVQVAAKHSLSSDKKLQLLFTLGKVDAHIDHLDQSHSVQEKQKIRDFVAQIRKKTDNQELLNSQPDDLFKDATLIIDGVFALIFTGVDRLQKRIHLS
ncbi:nitrate- and nitrite sensing domain-containing protein [Marinomonas pollencensis]|uniref:Nitrate/nitrite sensing protein n=1 Tax=Marinomonas pollencensis TaxID=491954 RepID=A0A3E0DN14_9GAMM|nr:nitrate- and nitrite sensing domain-containing protein [Marinomonas pollencensis]REG84227.1 nitrate/nitrite sensing protein [Marinomonas pollencensis]